MSGGYFTKVDLSSDGILGHEIYRYGNQGRDIWGMISGGKATWSTFGASRLTGYGQVTRIGNLSPNHTYDFVNSWGSTGTGSRYFASYLEQWYESFFDGYADNWYDGDSDAWSVGCVSDPGNYIDNLVMPLLLKRTIP